MSDSSADGDTMPATDHEATIRDWIAASNTHDTDAYLGYFTEDAVLDDPSVGRAFTGRTGIREYFESFFIGYNTTTAIVNITLRQSEFHVVVDFTGDFPGGQTAGLFDITFTGDRFSLVRADLIEGDHV